jgi:excisionase family DNA binding protein
MDTLLLSLEETARQLGGVSKRTVQRMIASGELCTVKVRRSVMVPSAIVKEWVENQLQPAHNSNRAGDVQGGKNICHTNVVTAPFGGRRTPMPADDELDARLAQRTKKKLRSSKQNGNSKHTGKNSGESSRDAPLES